MGCGGSKPEPDIRPAAADKGDPIAAGTEFAKHYELGKQLGAGAFSVVKEGFDRRTKASYAIKIVTKSKLSAEDELALKDEISILKGLNHPNIIRLFNVFDEKLYYFLVTEKMAGGELFDRIVKKTFYNEKEARDTVLVLFQAIDYIHKHNIAHRDLKPENLLLQEEDNDSNIKIADFGFAKKCPTPNSLTTQCGTPGYVAPEILEGVPYGLQADMWSLGVIVFILLGGYPPFADKNQRDLFRKIRKGQYEFQPDYWNQVSEEAKDLIRSLLTVDPTKRSTAGKVLEHKWVKGSDEVLVKYNLGPNLEEFRKFNAKRKMKAAIKAVIATNKLTSLGENIKSLLD